MNGPFPFAWGKVQMEGTLERRNPGFDGYPSRDRVRRGNPSEGVKKLD